MTIKEEKKITKKSSYRRWIVAFLKSKGVTLIDNKRVNLCSNKMYKKKIFELTQQNSVELYLNRVECKLTLSILRCSLDKNGFVYFIGNIEAGVVKIGFSKNPKSRISGIQTGTHLMLSILKVVEGNYGIEKQYHRKFSRQRIRGEWYSITGHLKDYIGI